MTKREITDLNNSLIELRQTLEYKQRRPLLRVDKDFLVGLFVVSDLITKAIAIWWMLNK